MAGIGLDRLHREKKKRKNEGRNEILYVRVIGDKFNETTNADPYAAQDKDD